MKKLILLLVTLLLISCNNETKQTTNLEDVPDWAKEAVWYQIFPERFHNADPSNDPQPIDMAGAWPYFVPDDWQVHPWTSDWYKLQPWEEATGRDFYGNANIRRYGGDLQGVIDKLDYLKDLGITAIYLNPIFEAPSLHKYDASMYHHVDNNFGPNPEKDREIWATEDPNDPSTWKWTSADSLFLKLIEEVHNRDMKIIIDGVFNHTGTQFWAFKDIVENQENSKYVDWYTIKTFDDPNTEENEFDYEGWLGIKDLPEFREDEYGLVSGPSEHVHAIVKRWMDPNGDGDPSDGIDGWRLDVAEMVSHNFWRTFRKWVRDINPEAYLTGEVWWEDWQNNKMFNASPWFGDQFDAVMNYRFTRAVKHLVFQTEEIVGPQGFIDSMKAQYADYPKDNIYVLMNLLGSHDTERLASLIVNPNNWYDHYASVKDNPDFDVRKPNAEERAKQRLAVGINMTMPGAPFIYYGDEAGMWGGDDPDDRKPMVWAEFEYEDETTHPFGKERPVDKVEFDQELFNWYKNLIAIRNNNKVLSLGDIDFFVIDEQNEVFGYIRTLEDESAWIVINNNPNSYSLDYMNPELFPMDKSVTELITNKNYKFDNRKLKTDLQPYQILVLK